MKIPFRAYSFVILMAGLYIQGCSLPDDQMLFASHSSVGWHLEATAGRPRSLSLSIKQKDFLSAPANVDSRTTDPTCGSYAGVFAFRDEGFFAAKRIAAVTACGKAARKLTDGKNDKHQKGEGKATSDGAADTQTPTKKAEDVAEAMRNYVDDRIDPKRGDP